MVVQLTQMHSNSRLELMSKYSGLCGTETTMAKILHYRFSLELMMVNPQNGMKLHKHLVIFRLKTQNSITLTFRISDCRELQLMKAISSKFSVKTQQQTSFATSTLGTKATTQQLQDKNTILIHNTRIGTIIQQTRIGDSSLDFCTCQCEFSIFLIFKLFTILISKHCINLRITMSRFNEFLWVQNLLDLLNIWPLSAVNVKSTTAVHLRQHEYICKCDLVANTILALCFIQNSLKCCHTSCVKMVAPWISMLLSKSLLDLIQHSKVGQWLSGCIYLFTQTSYLPPLVRVLRQ